MIVREKKEGGEEEDDDLDGDEKKKKEAIEDEGVEDKTRRPWRAGMKKGVSPGKKEDEQGTRVQRMV